jgi:2-amino-4-hydroxy-6-hydroxymethyldihydropteridine diphosphokinase
MKGIYLLLGSNEGDRLRYLQHAAGLVGGRVGRVLRWSSVYRTEAWGVRDQADFMNSVLEVDSTLTPEDLLMELLEIERDLGRKRRNRWAERVIDIDILYYGDLVVQSGRLTVPHPEIQNRMFTLVPMCEVAPDLVHPVLKLDQKTLLQYCADPLGVIEVCGVEWIDGN